MLQRINKTDMSPSTMGYRFEGEIDDVAFDTLSKELTQSAYKNGEINLLLEVDENISVKDPMTLFRSLARAFPDGDNINRLAFVTDQTGYATATKGADAIPGINVHHFAGHDQQTAWRWVATGELPTA